MIISDFLFFFLFLLIPYSLFLFLFHFISRTRHLEFSPVFLPLFASTMPFLSSLSRPFPLHSRNQVKSSFCYFCLSVLPTCQKRAPPHDDDAELTKIVCLSAIPRLFMWVCTKHHNPRFSLTCAVSAMSFSCRIP
eukprot:TRINITY_DN25_c0_g1_i6.p1 TRINITY_DN25_c0_g1~~TRINITY_DN25_c0_g1_i6.p1  ORF type:complete len:135 (-),score=11.08 TRINITY_DN25_c0_g1_i6:60-464(-)